MPGVRLVGVRGSILAAALILMTGGALGFALGAALGGGAGEGVPRQVIREILERSNSAEELRKALSGVVDPAVQPRDEAAARVRWEGDSRR